MPTPTHENDNATESRTDKAVVCNALVRHLKGCAYELWRASLCAGPQHIRDLFNELKDPKPGDLVMETTTHLMKSRDPLEGIGTLVAVGEAPYYATREEARAAGCEDNEPIPTRQVWDITLDFDDGRLFRWENAMFIKVKTSHVMPNNSDEGRAKRVPSGDGLGSEKPPQAKS